MRLLTSTRTCIFKFHKINKVPVLVLTYITDNGFKLVNDTIIDTELLHKTISVSVYRVIPVHEHSNIKQELD